MNRFLIWGTGAVALSNIEFFNKINVVSENKIIGFIDNDQKKWGGMVGKYNIFPPDAIGNISFDYICIWVKNREEIYRQIVDELGILENKIVDIFTPYKQLIFDKYKNTNDYEICKIINKIKMMQS